MGQEETQMGSCRCQWLHCSVLVDEMKLFSRLGFVVSEMISCSARRKDAGGVEATP